MTRKFRLGLFVSMAAAMGLHVRPCWTCCWIPSFSLDGGVVSRTDAAVSIQRSSVLPSAANLGLAGEMPSASAQGSTTTRPDVPEALDADESAAADHVMAAAAPVQRDLEGPAKRAESHRSHRARPALRRMWHPPTDQPGGASFPAAE